MTVAVTTTVQLLSVFTALTSDNVPTTWRGPQYLKYAQLKPINASDGAYSEIHSRLQYVPLVP